MAACCLNTCVWHKAVIWELTWNLGRHYQDLQPIRQRTDIDRNKKHTLRQPQKSLPCTSQRGSYRVKSPRSFWVAHSATKFKNITSNIETDLWRSTLSYIPARVKASIHLVMLLRHSQRHWSTSRTKAYTNKMCLLRLQHHHLIFSHRSDRQGSASNILARFQLQWSWKTTFEVRPPRSGVLRMCFKVLTNRGSDWVSLNTAHKPRDCVNLPVGWRTPVAWWEQTSPECWYLHSFDQSIWAQDSMPSAWSPRIVRHAP